MNIEDTFDLFEQLLDIKIEIKNNEAIFYYDKKRKLQMEVEKNNKLLLDDLELHKFYTVGLNLTKEKMFDFKLREPIENYLNDKNNKKQIILQVMHFFSEKNLYSVYFSEDDMWCKTHEFIFRNTTSGDFIDINSNNFIFFSIDGRYGSYNNGFNEGDLSEKEMRKALENREFLILANYYGKFYPGLLETLQNARTHAKEIKKLNTKFKNC